MLFSYSSIKDLYPRKKMLALRVPLLVWLQLLVQLPDTRHFPSHYFHPDQLQFFFIYKGLLRDYVE